MFKASIITTVQQDHLTIHVVLALLMKLTISWERGARRGRAQLTERAEITHRKASRHILKGKVHFHLHHLNQSALKKKKKKKNHFCSISTYLPITY